MPSVSKKQHNLMAAVAHSPEFAKKVGIKQSVGKEFMTADKGKKFKEGGIMKHEDIKEDLPMMKKVAKQEVAAHEKRMHKGMAKGGVTGEAMKKYGRNMARAMNQRSTGRGR